MSSMDTAAPRRHSVCIHTHVLTYAHTRTHTHTHTHTHTRTHTRTHTHAQQCTPHSARTARTAHTSTHNMHHAPPRTALATHHMNTPITHHTSHRPCHAHTHTHTHTHFLSLSLSRKGARVRACARHVIYERQSLCARQTRQELPNR